MLLPSGGVTLGGWDNPTHLNLLRLNIKLGSFVSVQPNSPAGVRYFGWEYPQGWHQTWAQWVRLWYRTPPSSARSLVDIYSVALVVTAGIAVMLGCVAIARLCRDNTFAALAPMVVVAQLLAVGVLSMSIYSGFPNIGIAVIAVAVAPSILLRPTLKPAATFFVVSGLMLVGVYNWWPFGAARGADARRRHVEAVAARRRNRSPAVRGRRDRVRGARDARTDRADAAPRREPPAHQRRDTADAVVARLRVDVRVDRGRDRAADHHAGHARQLRLRRACRVRRGRCRRADRRTRSRRRRRRRPT